jgi:branched-chain amino acid transport system permease protein
MRNNQSFLKTAISFGLTAGVVLLFLSLIGFTPVVGQILFDANKLKPFEYGTVLVLIGFVIGLLSANKVDKEKDWKTDLSSSAISSVVAGLMMSIFVLAMYFIDQSGNDARTYLVKLSPDNVSLFLLDSSWIVSGLVHIAALLIGSLLGIVFLKGVWRADWRKRAVVKGKERVEDMKQSPLAEKIQTSKYGKTIMIVGGLALLFVMPFVWGSYWNYVMGTVGIYILLGLGMNIIVGLSGQLVLGYVAFFAVGAYTVGLLTSPVPLGIELGFWPALLASIVAAALTGLLLGLPILNLRGDYLAIVTLGFGEIIRILVKSDSLTPLTGGPKGLRNIAKPTLFGMDFSNDVNFMHLILIGVLVGIFIAYRLQNSRSGRAWLSVQGDQIVSRATGVNTYYYKILALGLGAAFAGVGGALFASRNQFTGPEDHIMMVSINVLCLVIVGGMGSLPGVILGALVLKGIPELLRDLTDYRLLVFGVLLVIMMIVRPEGLWPTQRPKLAKKAVAAVRDDKSVEEVQA